MANDSSDFIAFLADDDAAVHAMMSGGANRTSESPAIGDAAAAEADGNSCGVYNWPVLFLFTIVIAAIGTTLFIFVNVL